jgi:hypothetical protein
MSTHESAPEIENATPDEQSASSCGYEPPRLVAVGNLHEILAGALGSQADGIKGGRKTGG